MFSTLFKGQSIPEIEKLWQSEPFIYDTAPKQNLTRWEVFQTALLLSQFNFDTNETNPLSAIVLFQQRQHFLIACLAIALKKGQAILPPNLAENTLTNLQSEHANLWVFGDDPLPTLNNQQSIQSTQIDEIINQVKATPQPFNATQLADAILSCQDSEIWLYTSGSTGLPKKVVKTWFNMIQSANLAIERFDLMTPCFIVATVPNQHMFGLETTIFWPFFSKASLWHERPIFPEDVISALSENTQSPALLVSTPLHLNKLIAFDLDWPKHLSRLISATAPLPKALAVQIEQQLDIQAFEVYGSTETASIASKQTTASEMWQTYKTTEFQKLANGSYAVKTAGLTDFQPLNDQIELTEKINNQHFKLGKRDSDLIKIAGKRASLAELNLHLQSIEGISEGVFMQPDHSQRLSAFVASTLSSPQILKALRKSIDPVFLPRPIIFLSELPRNEVGKVLYNELQSQVTQ